MLIALGDYQLDIDRDRTAAFYKEDADIGCDCDGCRNYAMAISLLPSAVRQQLEQFGIDPSKPAEVYVQYAPGKDTVNYGGFYHVCGTIQAGPSPWIQIDQRHFCFNEQCRIVLCDDCSIFISDDIHLLEENFPKPVLQIEIDFTLPWVLPTPNPY